MICVLFCISTSTHTSRPHQPFWNLTYTTTSATGNSKRLLQQPIGNNSFRWPPLAMLACFHDIIREGADDVPPMTRAPLLQSTSTQRSRPNSGQDSATSNSFLSLPSLLSCLPLLFSPPTLPTNRAACSLFTCFVTVSPTNGPQSGCAVVADRPDGIAHVTEPPVRVRVPSKMALRERYDGHDCTSPYHALSCDSDVTV